jgi:outer membrane protein
MPKKKTAAKASSLRWGQGSNFDRCHWHFCVCTVENILIQFSKPFKSISHVLVCVIAFFSVSHVQAQDFRIAYFDGQRVINESVPSKMAITRIKQEFAKRQKELDDLNENLRNLARKYDKEVATLSELDRTKRQRELTELDQDFNRKQRIFKEDVAQRQQEELNALGERALKVVKQIAEAEKIDLVIQDAAYFSARIDITEKVLKALAK